MCPTSADIKHAATLEQILRDGHFLSINPAMIRSHRGEAIIEESRATDCLRRRTGRPAVLRTLRRIRGTWSSSRTMFRDSGKRRLSMFANKRGGRTSFAHCTGTRKGAVHGIKQGVHLTRRSQVYSSRTMFMSTFNRLRLARTNRPRTDAGWGYARIEVPLAAERHFVGPTDTVVIGNCNGVVEADF